MSRTNTRFTIKAAAVAGLCGAAMALSPDAAAAPLKTGGYDCIVDAAGVAAGGPVGAAAAACAPVADMAGIPMVLPGPLPLGAAALGVPVPVVVPPVPVVVPPIPAVVPPVPVVVPPIPAVVPPVPVVVPPVPAVVPPVPVVVPPVPIGAAALGAPIPVGGAAVVGAPLPLGAPIIDMAGGKGAATGAAPVGAPVPGQPILAGPAAG